MSFFGDIERLIADLYPYRVPITAALVAFIAVAATLVVRRGWHRPPLALASRHRLAAGAVSLLVAVMLVVVGDYLLSPLWERSTLIEASPLDVASSTVDTDATTVAAASTTPSSTATPRATATPATTQASTVTATASPTATSTATPDPTSTATPTESSGEGARIVKQGPFSGADSFHFANGQALLIETAPGEYTLRFEDFSILNGPDLYVYLSSNAGAPSADGVRLGRLKATDGAFNYEVPADVDPTVLGYALVWCDQFAVRFATAPLDG